MDAKKLREDRAGTAKEMRRLADLSNDAGHKWSDEDEQNWTKVNEDFNRMSTRLEKLERIEVVEDRLSTVHEVSGLDSSDPEKRDWQRQTMGQPSQYDRAIALQAWCLRQCDHEINDDQAHAARKCGVDPERRFMDISPLPTHRLADFRKEQRMTTSAAAGGETIPEGFVRQWEMALLAFGGVRQVADVIRTETGNDLVWPTTNDTGNSGRLLSEGAAVTETDVSTSSMTLQAYKYSSDLVKVSAELMADSAFDLANELGRILGERIARITNNHFTVGTGSSQPNGLVTASAAGVTAAGTAAITTDELFDLEHSVDPAYRGSAFRAGFMMEDATIKALRKLKDGDNRYLWSPGGGLLDAAAGQLLGYPVTMNQDMDSLATGKKTVVFGAFSKYKVRDAGGIRLRRLVERYADNDLEGFVAFSRHDADELDASTNPIKHLIQA